MSDQQPKYPSVTRFVEGYLGQIYQRQVNDSNTTVWCEQWWRHHEAAVRLDALWRSWELLHRDERGGLSHWLLHHADPHMSRLFDPTGTFRYCGVRHGHADRIAPLAVDSMPEVLIAERPPGPADRTYQHVAEFVEVYVAELYRRQVVDVSGIVWCPQWWRHLEAVERFDAMWRAWEYLRKDPAEGLSKWLLDHGDPHMAKLFDPTGPFKYCDARGGHQSNSDPLPITSEMAGMFTNPEPGRISQ